MNKQQRRRRSTSEPDPSIRKDHSVEQSSTSKVMFMEQIDYKMDLDEHKDNNKLIPLKN
jgi:hypothetical protein